MGQFIGDQADGHGQIEDANTNLFAIESGKLPDGSDCGSIQHSRLQNMCSVMFVNGDKFKGIFKDGRPNGEGIMFYKNSLRSGASGVSYELAKYQGTFMQGKREGKGTMVWDDGTVFEGVWRNDQRLFGRLIMNNGFTYIGHFKNDKIDGPCEQLLLPNHTIFEGEFVQGKNVPIGLLLYPNGTIYYGQHD